MGFGRLLFQQRKASWLSACLPVCLLAWFRWIVGIVQQTHAMQHEGCFGQNRRSAARPNARRRERVNRSRDFVLRDSFSDK